MPQVRRKPSQERGKEKVDVILGAAKALIGERGNDAVSMREIAKFAGIAPSSIYQYFPDKNAIIAAIMQGYFDRMQGIAELVIADIKDVSDVASAVDTGLDQFYQLFKDEPTLSTIWAGVQANTELREMDIQDSKQKAQLMAGMLCKLAPSLNKTQVRDACFLFAHLAGTTVRLALSVGSREGKRLMNELKTLITLRLQNLAES